MTELKRRPLPHDFHPPVPSFTVTSEDVAEGATLKDAQVYAAGNTSAAALGGLPAGDQELCRDLL